MPPKPQLLPGACYHIYNRGNVKLQIFRDSTDYSHLVELMPIYLPPVMDIYAYALIPNHFHLAVRIKPTEEIGWLNPRNSASKDLALKWATTSEPPISGERIKPDPEKMLRHMMSGYVRWLNARYDKRGKMLTEHYQRKLLESENQLRRLIVYINRNGEHHALVKSFVDYPWTSYSDLISESPTWLDRKAVIQLFRDRSTFILAHQQTEFDDWFRNQEIP